MSSVDQREKHHRLSREGETAPVKVDTRRKERQISRSHAIFALIQGSVCVCVCVFNSVR